jgi:glutamate---cysteine ligase / carboxylate-amine ligase
MCRSERRHEGSSIPMREPDLVSAPLPKPYPHRFGASPPLSVGVEEELLLVDERRRLIAASEAVIDSISGPLAGRVSAEIFTEQIELKTGICHGAGEALHDLRETRRAVLEAGFGLLGSGLHPSARSGDVRLVAKPRYEIVRRDLGSLLRTPPCGLHVHIGIPDPEVAVRIANAFRLYLPALQALSANSPFQNGTDSGHASARTSVVRSYPRFQVPREFRDYEDFCHVADQLIAAAGVDDYTYIWWDVRPHPQLGTVEVRALDVQADVTASASIAALIQAIAAKELDRPSTPGLSREALEESYFQAASHGLEAEIILDEETPEPARAVARRMLDSVRPYARELGEEAALEEVERILREGNGADDQRRVHREDGIDGLLDYLAERA